MLFLVISLMIVLLFSGCFGFLFVISCLILKCIVVVELDLLLLFDRVVLKNDLSGRVF